ncbi:NAD(+) diphosphatase [Microbacterium aurantiacum]|uniref:NAD(+) diphosphatase n=1 Tax=Microbacterium aurantiacum TaxID=162393 RepID=UPI000C80A743|nr:NAD(+) diphosphatase [Microbacterium aurantiacum]
MIIQGPTLDRAAEIRTETDVIDRLRADANTRVLVVRDGRVRVALPDAPPAGAAPSEEPAPTLVLAAPAEVGDATWALLGRDDAGAAVLLAATADDSATIDAAPEETWLGLRDIAGRLHAADVALLVEAVALAGWLRDAPFCPACGNATDVIQAGWSRRCRSCGREHFPRTDPAVIVAVESVDGERLLLGANANWGGRMYSCFAGFAEAGESLEQVVHREIEEEAGVRLTAIRYISSQSWPYPRSLMIGFRAVVEDESVARADGEEIIDVRWFTRAEIGSALEGRGPVGLPGSASIARALIRDWYEDRT